MLKILDCPNCPRPNLKRGKSLSEGPNFSLQFTQLPDTRCSVFLGAWQVTFVWTSEPLSSTQKWFGVHQAISLCWCPEGLDPIGMLKPCTQPALSIQPGHSFAGKSASHLFSLLLHHLPDEQGVCFRATGPMHLQHPSLTAEASDKRCHCWIMLRLRYRKSVWVLNLNFWKLFPLILLLAGLWVTAYMVWASTWVTCLFPLHWEEMEVP